jgi:uncharacterized membrane protein YgdD (TMEM256/DUF423 family)
MTAARIHLLIAALMGAAGVSLWAMAAHRAGGAQLVTAAQFLLLHAATVIGLTAARKQRLLADLPTRIAISGLLAGALLFSGDLALRALAGRGLFPFAAPAGGFLLIGSWLLAAASAIKIDRDDQSS